MVPFTMILHNVMPTLVLMAAHDQKSCSILLSSSWTNKCSCSINEATHITWCWCWSQGTSHDQNCHVASNGMVQLMTVGNMWHWHQHYCITFPKKLCRAFDVGFSFCWFNLEVGWFSLGQNISWSVDKLSSTSLDFIRSERELENMCSYGVYNAYWACWEVWKVRSLRRRGNWEMEN